MEEVKIQDSFDSTLKNTDLQGVVVDIAEVGIDAMFDDGLLRDVPIVGTIAGLAKFGANVRDRLFLQKILTFLNQLKNISPEKRKKMIDSIDASKKFRVKVGEKLLFSIDACNDYEISELVGRLFSAYLEEKVSYDDFLKASAVLEKIAISDFNWFIENGHRPGLDLGDVKDLISSGLFELYYEQVSVRVDEKERTTTLMENKYQTEVDGGMSVHLSSAGETILEVFSDKYEKKETITI